MLILTALQSFLVLNLQNSGIRKCLQKGFEEVTETELRYSAALSMDKQNIATSNKEKKSLFSFRTVVQSPQKVTFAFSGFTNNAVM